MGSTEYKLASAARRWRLQGKGCEAFAGMEIVLVSFLVMWSHLTLLTQMMPSPKRDQFSRLVEAGGGRVVTAKPPYSNTQGVTHVLTESKHLGKEKVGGSLYLAPGRQWLGSSLLPPG